MIFWVAWKCLKVSVVWVVGQPISLSLPTQVKVELGCDNILLCNVYLVQPYASALFVTCGSLTKRVQTIKLESPKWYFFVRWKPDIYILYIVSVIDAC